MTVSDNITNTHTFSMQAKPTRYAGNRETDLLKSDKDSLLDTVLLKVWSDRTDDLVDDASVDLGLCVF